MRQVVKGGTLAVGVIGLVGLLGLGASGVRAQVPVTLSFQPDLAHIECEGTVDVDVRVDAAATDLRVARVVIGFNRDVIGPTAVVPGGLLDGAPCPDFFYWDGDAAADSVAVDLAGLGCSLTGPGSLLRITFHAHDLGESPLEVRSVVLRDSANGTIPAQALGGGIHAECAVPNAGSTWGKIKTLYR